MKSVFFDAGTRLLRSRERTPRNREKSSDSTSPTRATSASHRKGGRRDRERAGTNTSREAKTAIMLRGKL